MTVANANGVIAGVKSPFFFMKAVSGSTLAGRPVSYWGSVGMPGAGAYDNTLNGVVLRPVGSDTHVDGQFPVPSGEIQLNTFSAGCSQPSHIVLCDRVWHNGNIANNTTLQSITSPTWAARDATGSTNGEGVVLGLEISATTGANAPSVTVTYTNSAGTGSRTGNFIIPTAASAVLRTFYPITLQSGDVGVRSVQSLQFGGTAWASGTVHLVAYRVLGAVAAVVGNVPNDINILTGGGALMCPTGSTRAVPFLIMIPQTTTSSRVWGHVQVVAS